jgi:hypothetical protein
MEDKWQNRDSQNVSIASIFRWKINGKAEILKMYQLPPSLDGGKYYCAELKLCRYLPVNNKAYLILNIKRPKCTRF